MSKSTSRDFPPHSHPVRTPLHPGERTRTGVRSQSLRAMNLSLVLQHVLAQPGAITRATIAARTGITPATVSRLVDDLITEGLVHELPPASESTRGRPAYRLAPTRGRAVALGLEVNVSGIDARLVDLTGEVLAESAIDGDFADSDPEEVMATLSDLAHRIATAAPEALFIGTGLALPGLVSPDSLTRAPNLGWRDLPFKTLLAPLHDLGITVVANEADLAAFAVSHPVPGVPCGPASFIYLSGEVGVGGGVVIDHVPLTGANGWSGEIGHICVDPSGPVCSCGARGCLESFLGRRALALRAGLDRNARLADVLKAAEGGANSATQALEEAGTALGLALAAAVNLIDVPLVLLGGSIAELSDALGKRALEEMRVRVLQAPWSPPRMEAVPDSRWLAVTGAAHAVLQGFIDDPLALVHQVEAP